MTASEQPGTKEIMAAIQNVQQDAGAIQKASTGQVGTRAYKYAGLNEVWQAVSPLLKQNDLVITQSPSIEAGVGQVFTTTIYHIKSGQSITERMPLILQKDDPQGIGSAITYYRRYMLMSMLGLVPDDDTDAREHRLATAEQKARIVGAVKFAFPDIDRGGIVSTIQDIVGKHPSRIREDEVEHVIGLIKAFKED